MKNKAKNIFKNFIDIALSLAMSIIFIVTTVFFCAIMSIVYIVYVICKFITGVIDHNKSNKSNNNVIEIEYKE